MAGHNPRVVTVVTVVTAGDLVIRQKRGERGQKGGWVPTIHNPPAFGFGGKKTKNGFAQPKGSAVRLMMPIS